VKEIKIRQEGAVIFLCKRPKKTEHGELYEVFFMFFTMEKNKYTVSQIYLLF